MNCHTSFLRWCISLFVNKCCCHRPIFEKLCCKDTIGYGSRLIMYPNFWYMTHPLKSYCNTNFLRSIFLPQRKLKVIVSCEKFGDFVPSNLQEKKGSFVDFFSEFMDTKCLYSPPHLRGPFVFHRIDRFWKMDSVFFVFLGWGLAMEFPWPVVPSHHMIWSVSRYIFGGDCSRWGKYYVACSRLFFFSKK